jgi:hypothetical protein
MHRRAVFKNESETNVWQDACIFEKIELDLFLRLGELGRFAFLDKKYEQPHPPSISSRTTLFLLSIYGQTVGTTTGTKIRRLYRV